MKWRATPQGRLATDANQLISDGDHVAALELLELALTHSPRDPIILTYRGRVLAALDQYEEAERSLRDALRIDEGLTHAWNELGMLREARGEFEKAAFCYQRSAEISPSAEIWTMLANVQLVFDPESSVENADRALMIDSKWSEAQVVRDAARVEIARQRARPDSR